MLDEDRQLARLSGLAENPNLPPHLQDRLVAAADQELTAELAGVRRDVPEPQHDEPQFDDLVATLTRMAELADQLARNAALDELEPLLRHESGMVRQVLACRTDLPQWAYAQLAADPMPWIRKFVASNPAVSERLLWTLADDSDADVVGQLALNPAVPLQLLIRVALTVRIRPKLLPRIASATEAELRVLAGSDSRQVRALVAVRRELPRELIDELVDDPEVAVVKAVIANPRVEIDQLWAGIKRHGHRVFPQAAQNPNCSAELLHYLAENSHPVEKAYREIARHPNSTAATLLLCLPNAVARRSAARHPNLPSHIIAELLDDADLFVAEAAAANPALPTAIMESLLTWPS